MKYFNKSKGIQTSLLSFFSLESNTSTEIAESLKKIIEKDGLSFENITAYCADNASINFGKNQSVFTELRKSNNELIAIGCNAHILHNTAKKACNTLKIDIESVVIKIYNEFSSSTKRTAELKDFFEWTDTEWAELLRHAPTRWLTLLPAVERIISNFTPIKSYFMSQNSIAPLLRLFFDDDLSLAYLGFVANVCNSFQPALTRLQSDEALIVEMYEIMNNVRQSLNERKAEQFYGLIARTEIQKCNNDEAIARFKIDTSIFFETTVNYLEKWFNFEDNKFSKLRPVRLLE